MAIFKEARANSQLHPIRLESVSRPQKSLGEILILSGIQVHGDKVVEHDGPQSDSIYTTSMGFLLHSEAELVSDNFGVEQSSLWQLNQSFPSIEGKNFEEWIGGMPGIAVLEIGGGKNQTVAREILQKHRNIEEYIALEPRNIVPDAKEDLDRHPNYIQKQVGISNIERAINGKKVDVVFAHYVAEWLPSPYFLLQQGLAHLQPGGMLFVNRVPILIHAIPFFIELLQKQGLDVAAVRENPPEQVWKQKAKQGIVLLNLGVRQNTEEATVPIKEIVVFNPNTKLTSFDFLLAA